MTVPSLDSLGVLALISGAGWYLVGRALHRFQTRRRPGPSPSCGGCTGCSFAPRSRALANPKDGASCVDSSSHGSH